MKILAGYLFLSCAWGTSWMVIKFSNAAFPPLLGASLRFWGAGLILAAATWILRKRQRKCLAEWGVITATGVLTFIAGYGLVYVTEDHLDSHIVAAVFGTFPVFTALISHFMLPAERLRMRGTVGVTLGFCGVLFLTAGAGFSVASPLPWILIVLLSPAACALNVVMIKRWGSALNPYSLNVVPMLMGGSGLWILSLLTERGKAATWTPSGWLALGYLTLFVTVIAFTIYYDLLERMSAVLLSSTAYVSLVIAVLSGWLILGERVGAGRLIGIGAILAGVILVQSEQRTG